jgi:hypothetical protein
MKGKLGKMPTEKAIGKTGEGIRTRLLPFCSAQKASPQFCSRR